MTKMRNDLDVSVLIATYNRAEILRQTLESMTHLDRDELLVEFVVVDNNSSDNTKEVIESFAGKLPIRYLFEPRPGKNCALNKALNEVPLGQLVVFTDDDVKPREDWLKAIITITNRWPGYNVFGGKIFLILPYNPVPKWVGDPSIPHSGLAAHDYADTECVYARTRYPNGPNFWVRREVFTGGRTFNETVGPRPRNYIMGSESFFLVQLEADGFRIVYSPQAVVGHRIRPEQLTLSHIRKRAFRSGRLGPRIQGLCRRRLFERHIMFWFFIRIGGIIKATFQYLRGTACLSELRGIEMKVRAIFTLGYNVESIKLAWKERREQFSRSDES
jgi:glycosyltransferase involved in cell wall biosynthesis